VAHQAGAYPSFCGVKYFCCPLWMGCWSTAGLPPTLNLPVPSCIPE